MTDAPGGNGHSRRGIRFDPVFRRDSVISILVLFGMLITASLACRPSTASTTMMQW